jgi:aspartate aminotransferase-like enzyme
LSAETSTGSINPVDELRQETKLAEQSLPVDSSGG